jgi:hypothetical protein
MDMSWQTTFALACAAVFAAIVPGTLGYATARLETADQQRHELIRLRAEVQAARKAVQQVSAPCKTEAKGTGPATSSSGGDAIPASPDPLVRRLPPQARSGSGHFADPPASTGTPSDPEADLAPLDQE